MHPQSPPPGSELHAVSRESTEFDYYGTREDAKAFYDELCQDDKTFGPTDEGIMNVLWVWNGERWSVSESQSIEPRKQGE